MLPFKKIVWPTDFSEPSMKALEPAVELAHHFFAELYLVYVVPPVPVVARPQGAPIAFNPEKYQKQLEQDGRLHLKELAESKVAKDLTVHQLVKSGQPADEIAKVAEEVCADVIVIATHGATGWRRLVFGSVTAKVMQQAKCPVLTVVAEHC